MDTNLVSALTDIFFKWCGPTKTVELIKFLLDKGLLELKSTLVYNDTIALYFKGKDKIQLHLILISDSLHVEFTDFHSRHEIVKKADIEGFLDFIQKKFEVDNDTE